MINKTCIVCYEFLELFGCNLNCQANQPSADDMRVHLIFFTLTTISCPATRAFHSWYPYLAKLGKYLGPMISSPHRLSRSQKLSSHESIYRSPFSYCIARLDSRRKASGLEIVTERQRMPKRLSNGQSLQVPPRLERPPWSVKMH